MFQRLSLFVFIIFFLSACDSSKEQTNLNKSSSENIEVSAAGKSSSVATEVTNKVSVDAQMLSAVNDTASWSSYGRTYDEQRHSPAALINKSNVDQLGLAWFADMDTARGQEATPLVIDGKIYVSTAWSKVKAFDAKTGEALWSYDPNVPGASAVNGCCDVVNRGLAAWDESLFLGTFDGRLVSLDRETGNVQWSVVTVDQSKPYSITGAPRVIDGLVVIGNGGAEMGVRGYVTAYDSTTGKQVWRFYTVPDNPANGEQPEYLQEAAKTWTGEWWKLGGGGTAWDAMAYDPELDLLYIGVGNGSPWNQLYRSPEGGDNLYLSSIVAVRPKTGEYVWHYQTTPGETWDFTATQHIMLADIEIEGKQRKVLMQAPKNGFFYVLDRATGELISANNFVPVNWATGIDMETGRPIETPEARYYKTGKPFIGSPGAGGAHSWQPMAYDPKQNLVFIPAQLASLPYFHEENWEPAALGFNVGIDFSAGALPAITEVRKAVNAATKGALIAWDPVTQSERWRVEADGASNGGLLATAGDLIFQGHSNNELAAYATDSGEKLWSASTQTGVLASPITYVLDGEQYITVLAGWGGIWSLAPGGAISSPTTELEPVRNISRLLVFKLGGDKTLPEVPPLNKLPLDPPAQRGTEAQMAEGNKLYGRFCSTCHGDAVISGGIVPDLRYSTFLSNKDGWQKVVYDGVLESRGMVAWSPVMNAEQVDNVRHYIIKRAHEDKTLLDADLSAAK